jgi:hypothetical protein
MGRISRPGSAEIKLITGATTPMRKRQTSVSALFAIRSASERAKERIAAFQLNMHSIP